MADDNVDAPLEPGSGLLRSSALVGTMTMMSRVLGLIRDIVIAGFVGATANADAFYIAFKIPNFLRRLLPKAHFPRPLYRY
jgi:putative peptidoglycan lipid II flippase